MAFQAYEQGHLSNLSHGLIDPEGLSHGVTKSSQAQAWEEPAEALNRRTQPNHQGESYKEIFRPPPTLSNSNRIALV